MNRPPPATPKRPTFRGAACDLVRFHLRPLRANHHAAQPHRDIPARSAAPANIVNIAALRGIAAMMVMVVHMQPIAAADGIGAVWTEGLAAGVNLFFVISGFVMVYSTFWRRVTPASFMIGRLRRIVPLYWALTFFAFTVAIAAPRLMGGTRSHWDQLIKSLFFIPYPRDDGQYRPILFVGWTLNYEIFFYLIFSATLFLKSRRSANLTAMLALTAIVALGALVRLPQPFTFLTAPILLDFVAGMVIALIYVRLDPAPQAWMRPLGRAAIGVMVVGLAALAVWLPMQKMAGIALGPDIPAIVVIIGALVAERNGVLPFGQNLIKIGNASYALYLVHPFALQFIIKLSEKTHTLNYISAPIIASFAALFSIYVSVQVHMQFEKPITDFLQRQRPNKK